MGESFTQDPVVNGLLQDPENATALLYPGESAVSAEEIRFPSDKNPVVFIMDGSWSGAQKMMRLSENLHGLPRIKIDPETPSRFLIRRQPNPQGLEHLKNRHNNLVEVLGELVRIQLSYINDPNLEGRRRNPHVKTERPRSHKHYKIFPYFQD
jgi:hypothetical protein